MDKAIQGMKQLRWIQISRQCEEVYVNKYNRLWDHKKPVLIVQKITIALILQLWFGDSVRSYEIYLIKNPKAGKLIKHTSSLFEFKYHGTLFKVNILPHGQAT